MTRVARVRWVTLFLACVYLGWLPFLLPSQAQDQPEPKLAPMPVGRYMFVAAPIGNKIYCVGGSGRTADLVATLHVYDVARNTWTEKAKWPTRSSYPCGAAAGGKLYIIGGPTSNENPTSVVECYDPAKDRWERLEDLPIARSHSVAVALGERIYVLGGCGYFKRSDTGVLGGDLDDVSVLDTRTKRWSPGPRLPNPMHGMAAAVLGKTIHVFGGLSNQQQHLALEKGQWIKKADLPFAVVKMPATSLKGKGLVIGGGDKMTEVALYNAAYNKWTMGPSTRVNRFLSQVVTVGNTAYALGGIIDGGGAQTKLEAYDLEKNQWRE